MGRMDVTPQELRGSEIKEAFRGFNRDEVDDLLERAAATIENLTRQVQELESRAPSAPAPLPSNRDDADILQRTLLLAQRAADDAVNEAQAHARKLIEESEARAQALVGEAESTARHIAEGERRRLEEEISDLGARRDLLAVDADALDDFVSGYRDRVRAAIEADLERLGTPEIEPPSARPALHDVEIPATRFERAERAVEREPELPTRAIATNPESDPRLAQPSFAETPRPSETEWPPPADPSSGESSPAERSPAERSPAERSPAERSPAEMSPAGAATASVAAPPRDEFSAPGAAASSSWLSDAQSPSAVPADEPAPWDHLTAAHEPFVAETPMETPVEAHAVDTGDDLDDDAFFASLREAVRDEAPLGPREEPSQFFDDDPVDERRGHFRRRR
jgi:DivIVA domain-containing protein